MNFSCVNLTCKYMVLHLNCRICSTNKDTILIWNHWITNQIGPW